MTKSVMTPAGKFPSIKAACDAYKKNILYYIRTRPRQFYYLDEKNRREPPAPRPKKSPGRINPDWLVDPKYADISHLHSLPDPRIVLSKHIDWQYPGATDTNWSFPEPDNINHAVLADRYHFIPFLKNQIWYKDQYLNAWISLYSVPLAQLIEYENYLQQLPVWATWRSRREQQPRQLLTWIERDIKNCMGVRQKLQVTLDERLYALGQIERLTDLGASKEYLDQRIGVPRNLTTEVEEVTEDEE